MPRRTGLVILGVVGFVSALSAQSGYATLSGRVKDASGAVMPGVSIAATNVDTNVVLNTTTNGEGYYALANLIPGTYSLTAKAEGFREVQRGGIVLRVGDRVSIEVPMEVGSAAERVTVSAETPLLRSDDAQSGLVIDNRRIQELPQYNRNALAFALLTPNVNGTSDQMTHDSDFRINGGRAAQAEYFIDGAPVTTGYLHNVPNSVPSMEAVSEFRVLTNGLSAEYGRLSGGAVVLVTKSGTNNFHGSAYEYFRNEKLNANDWLSNRFGAKRAAFHDSVFGGAIGGPVLIPKIFSGRNKTFFFMNYEGTRHNEGSNAQLTGVPTALERQGDFSQSLVDQGVPVRLFDPRTGRLEAGTNRVVRDPYPGNRIPTSLFNPLSKIYLGYYPEANRAPAARSNNVQNYIGATARPSSNDRWTGKLDQNWSPNQMSHFSVTRFDDKSVVPRWLSALQPVTVSYSTSHTVAFNHTWTVKPTMLLDMRIGLVRISSFSEAQIAADTSKWGLQREVISLLGSALTRAPSVGPGESLASLGGGSVSNTFETNLTSSVSLQKFWGKHTVKIGYEHRRYYANIPKGGTFTMSTQRSVTSQYYDQPQSTGSGLASWLLGVVTTGSGTQLAGPASLQPYHGAYIQDDYKVSSRLTLNLGVRWDFEPPRTERFDRQIYWDSTYKWPWTPTPGWSWDLVLQQAGLAKGSTPEPEWITKGIYGRAALVGGKDYPGRISQETYPFNFAPRFGAAFQITPRTVLRGGYGINWLTTTGSRSLNGADRNVGYGDFARVNGAPDLGLTYPLTFDNPMPNGAGYVPYTRDILSMNRYTMGTWLIAPDYRNTAGYEHAVQLGIQREIGSGANAWVVEANYAGNFARGLPYFLGFGEHILPNSYPILSPLGTKLNQQVSNPFFGQIPEGTGMGGRTIPLGGIYRRNPLWLEIWTNGGPYLDTWGRANYNSGYVQAEHRFGRGFTFLMNYTVSKLLQDTGSIDNGQPQGVGEQFHPQVGGPLSDVYGIAPSDVSQKLLFNYSLEIPVGRGKGLLGNAPAIVDKVVGGWRLAGTTTLRSGQPIIIRIPSGAVGGLGSAWYNIGMSRTTRPVWVTPRVPYDNGVSGHAALEGSAGYTPYFNINSVRMPIGFELGDVGSVVPNLRGPGFTQWDISLLKDFGLWSESRKLQFRIEAQNLLNHMNAGQPDGGLSNRTFGMITSQSGPPRRVMAALKFSF
jgi:hypothetical protein